MGIPLVADMGEKKSSASNSILLCLFPYIYTYAKQAMYFTLCKLWGTWLNEILFIVSVMVTRLDPFHLKAHEQHLLELLSIKWWEGLRLTECVCHTAGV